MLDELRAAKALFEENAIRVEFFETRGFKATKDRLLFFVLDIPRFFLRVLNGIDVIHFHVSARGSVLRNLVLYRVTRMLQRKVIFHWHSNNLPDCIEQSNGWIKSGLRDFIESSDEAIGVSTAMAADIRKFRNGASVRVVGNCALNAERIASLGPAKAMNARDPQSYVAFSGSFSEEKGLSELFAAVAILKKKQRHIHVKLAGTGETDQWAELARQFEIEDRISFVGWLRGDELMDFYRNARVLCLPSHRESFGIATLEAMLCGLAVVGTRTGGFFDLVKEGKTGFLVESGNAGQLAEALEQVCVNPRMAWQMGEAGRRYGLACYSVRSVCAEYVLCYRGLR
ncbi:glycosyltransferase family 4 protein [Paraburkholderia sp. CNPSo 3076]|uniref:glycosyltransferase family 4 protein n=1 Tax=Paraburkholderia sp. CNPSo 3076 TaxID=2940936 RepID=UPI002259FFF7|nr:glycosyltransferase family 4 protein [Paraburkholderia sp. CNPSo 3076]MCX5544997.1 glycosyltransferase family 4 protein [Paraburkholderia sp. CNPSo 3076]